MIALSPVAMAAVAIVCGAGTRGAYEELREVAERLGADTSPRKGSGDLLL